MEIRWVWHDFKDVPPPAGSICVADRLYQKLQYRTQVAAFDNSRSGMNPAPTLVWGEWREVPHCGLVTPNV